VIELYPLILEVEDLADAALQAAEAVVGFEQARGQRQRDLVGVALAIGAAEAVVVEQLAEAEGQLARIELRNVALLAIGHIQIVEPRLEGLDAPAPEAALEGQPGVEGGNGHGAAQARARPVVELV